jgi:tetratricopeptide (TPR) repeat protein
LPEDWKARCYFAVDSLLAGNPLPMQDLDPDANMHIKLGDRLWGQANDNNSPEKDKEAIDDYKQAIDEYQRAIVLDPANTDAMNDYANAFWSLRVRFPQDQRLLDFAPKADRFARRANAMTDASTPAHLITAATLLEVLLGEGKPQEALKVLSEGEIPDHAFFDDVRWDLGEAHLCAEASDRKSRPSVHEHSNAQRKAGALFDMIRDHEEKREWQPFSFSDVPEVLSMVAPPVCRGSPEKALQEMPDPHGARYKLYEEKSAR